MESTRPHRVQLDAQPGHAIRRLHQISLGIFHQETEDLNITPVQYAILQTVRDLPGCDQRTLAGRIALDTSTTAGVVDRLEARGLLLRRISPTDRRVRLLALTPAGELLLAQTLPGMERTQERILEPLSPEQRRQFMELLQQLVTENNDLSRAPSERPR
ncbi:MAG: MarR family winged helix-turn-helix transcriptional regulator [Burkholderiales bacterium]|nr:MarR family winged helix-turn-helix transcriptional regulator [Burkholderiales bacterium]